MKTRRKKIEAQHPNTFKQNDSEYCKTDNHSNKEINKEQKLTDNYLLSKYIFVKTRRIKRSSLLDLLAKDNPDGIQGNMMIGWYRCAIVTSSLWMLFNYLGHYLEGKNVIVDWSTFDGLCRHFITLISAWMFYILWTHWAYINVKYLVLKDRCKLSKFLQHLLQAIPFGGTTYLLWILKISPVPAQFIISCCSIYFMKSHSYIQTNKELFRRAKNNEGHEKFPANINYKDFLIYLMVPCIVYEPDYPMEEPNYKNAIKRLFISFGVFIFSYPWLTETTKPIIEGMSDIKLDTKLRLIVGISRLMVVVLTCALCLFYFLFECICNFFADITGFADRRFYDDWWNSTTYEEFNKKWNKPVYEFLCRHIYLDATLKLNWSKPKAMIATIFFSALIHELHMIICVWRVSIIFGTIMMIQIPVFSIQRITMKNTTFGNYFFWFGIIIGMAMLIGVYGNYYADAILFTNTHYVKAQ